MRAVREESLESICIICIFSCIVYTGIKTGTAGDTSFTVNLDAEFAGLRVFDRYTGANAAAGCNTLLASDTVFICIDKTF